MAQHLGNVAEDLAGSFAGTNDLVKRISRKELMGQESS